MGRNLNVSKVNPYEHHIDLYCTVLYSRCLSTQFSKSLWSRSLVSQIGWRLCILKSFAHRNDCKEDLQLNIMVWISYVQDALYLSHYFRVFFLIFNFYWSVLREIAFFSMFSDKNKWTNGCFKGLISLKQLCPFGGSHQNLKKNT